jgi:hypothetical protein
MLEFFLIVGALSAFYGVAAYQGHRQSVDGISGKKIARAVARLSPWAEEHGFTCDAGDELRAFELIEVAENLVGFAGDAGELHRDAVAIVSQKLHYTVILHRRLAIPARPEARVLVAEALVFHESTVIASIDCSSPASSAFTIDYVGKVFVDGRVPTGLDAGELGGRIARLPEPARLRLLSGKLMIRCPGPLSPELADLLVAVLTETEARMPRPPQHGPHR